MWIYETANADVLLDSPMAEPNTGTAPSFHWANGTGPGMRGRVCEARVEGVCEARVEKVCEAKVEGYVMLGWRGL